MMMLGIYGPKLQYTMLKFDWGPVENGLYLTLLGASRVIALLIVLPLIFRLFKPRAPAGAANVSLRSAVEEEDENLAAGGEGRRVERGKTSAIADEAQRRREAEERHAKHVRLLHDSRTSSVLTTCVVSR